MYANANNYRTGSAIPIAQPIHQQQQSRQQPIQPSNNNTYNPSLPHGWEVRFDEKTQRIYFVNHNDRTTQWDDPRPLPGGWEVKIDPRTQRKYYVNHLAKTTQWNDPRPALSMANLSLQQTQQLQQSAQNHNNVQQSQHQRIPSIYNTTSPNNPFNTPTNTTNNQSPKVPPKPQINSSNINSRNSISQSNNNNNNDNTMPTTYAASSMQDKIREIDAAATRTTNGTTTTRQQTNNNSRQDNLVWYRETLQLALTDNKLTAEEERLLASVRHKMNISDVEHRTALESIGWTIDEFNAAKQRAQQQNNDDSRECVVCLDKASDHIILDCMHLCLCGECAAQYVNERNCPKCREPIRAIKKIY